MKTRCPSCNRRLGCGRLSLLRFLATLRQRARLTRRAGAACCRKRRLGLPGTSAEGGRSRGLLECAAACGCSKARGLAAFTAQPPSACDDAAAMRHGRAQFRHVLSNSSSSPGRKSPGAVRILQAMASSISGPSAPCRCSTEIPFAPLRNQFRTRSANAFGTDGQNVRSITGPSSLPGANHWDHRS